MESINIKDVLKGMSKGLIINIVPGSTESAVFHVENGQVKHSFVVTSSEKAMGEVLYQSLYEAEVKFLKEMIDPKSDERIRVELYGEPKEQDAYCEYRALHPVTLEQ